MIRPIARWAAFPLACALLYGLFLVKADVYRVLTEPPPAAPARYLPPRAAIAARAPAGSDEGPSLAAPAWIGRPPAGPVYYPTAATLDDDGVVLAGYSCASGVCFVEAANLDGDGQLLWRARYAWASAGESVPVDVAVDKGGNMFLTGYTASAGGGLDWTTAMYNPDGQQVWRARYGGATDMAVGTALAMADDGGLYVAGSTVAGYQWGESEGREYVVLRYDGYGQLAWSARHTWDAADNRARDLAVDREGSVYVTGHSRGSDTGIDFATLKYDRDGRLVWTARYSGEGEGSDFPLGLALDDEGAAYVVGYTTEGRRTRYLTVKYAPDGRLLWSARYPDDEGEYMPTAFAVDRHGGVYITGFAWRPAQRDVLEYVTLKYDGEGRLAWTAATRGGSVGSPWKLTVDEGANVYLAWRVWDEGSAGTGVAKYDASGTLMWVTGEAQGGSAEDPPVALLIGANGESYLVGRGEESGSEGFVITKRDKDGHRLWMARGGPAAGRQGDAS